MCDVLQQSEAAPVRDGPSCGEGNGVPVRNGAHRSWCLSQRKTVASDAETGGNTLRKGRFPIREGKLPVEAVVKPSSREKPGTRAFVSLGRQGHRQTTIWLKLLNSCLASPVSPRGTVCILSSSFPLSLPSFLPSTNRDCASILC